MLTLFAAKRVVFVAKSIDIGLMSIVLIPSSIDLVPLSSHFRTKPIDINVSLAVFGTKTRVFTESVQ
jgi:hypothetical protein